MKILLTILGLVATIIALLFVAGFFLPANLHVERTLEIQASPDVVYSKVAHLKEWSKWSFWDRIDTTMSSEHSDPDFGKGAFHKWESTHKSVGNGQLTIIDAQKNKLIATEIEFDGQGNAKGDWMLEEIDEGTEVTATFDSEMKGPISKWMGVLMKGAVVEGMDKSLENLKELSEKEPEATRWNMSEFQVIDMDDIPIYAVKSESGIQELSVKMGESFGALMAHIQSTGESKSGQPLTIYHEYSEQDDKVTMECGIPMEVTSVGKEPVIISKVPGGKMLMVKFYGNYDNLGVAHGKFAEYMSSNGLVAAGSPWEWYITDPGLEPNPEKWETDIYYPIQ